MCQEIIDSIPEIERLVGDEKVELFYYSNRPSSNI